MKRNKGRTNVLRKAMNRNKGCTNILRKAMNRNGIPDRL